jgi:predicted phage terminase large subunit-like protein
MVSPAVKQLIRTDLSYFIHQVFRTVSPSSIYQHNWHIDLIAQYLIACQKGDTRRLIINIPPRFLKSIAVSVAFPAWLLGHNPSTQIMCASYAMALSHKHSLDCRLVLEQDWYKEAFPNTLLVDDQNTKSKFVTTERGFRYATSIGSSVTGSGADYLIIDDPLNADMANSEVALNNANTWYEQVYSTRLNDPKKGCQILIMQRLHENDLSGLLLGKGGWEHLCLPLVAEKDETIEKGTIRQIRTTGDLLHPARIGEIEVGKLKDDLGPYGFAHQYQQQAAPQGGGVFKYEWIQYYDSVDQYKLNKYIFVDPANSKTKDSDFTAIVVIGVGQDKNIYILDMIRDRLDVKGREDIIFELHKKYSPMMVYYEKYGMQCDSDWIKHAMTYRNYRFAITEVGGILDKISRIRRLEAYFCRGQIWMPRSLYKVNYMDKPIDVVQDFTIHEYLKFPFGLHDDMLDAMSRLCDATLTYPGGYSFNYQKFYEGYRP